MKFVKRIVSVMLVLMLALSINVTVFADEATPRVDITIQPSDGSYSHYSVSANVGQSMYSIVDSIGNANWTEVPDWENPEVIHEALVSLDGKASTPINGASEIDRNKLLAKGYNYNSITWYESLPGYGLISNNDSGYTYIYAGYDWTYSSNINPYIWDYMCCYNVSAGEVVQLTYDFTVSVWTSDYPIA